MDRSLKGLYVRLRKPVANFLKESQSINAYLFCTLRTFAEQAELYAQGRTKPGKIVTQAKPGYSWHNWGLAFDIVFKNGNSWTWDKPDEMWAKLGEMGKKHGFEWGGSWRPFRDLPHFQLTYGLTCEELLPVYENHQQLSDVWAYIDAKLNKNKAKEVFPSRPDIESAPTINEIKTITNIPLKAKTQPNTIIQLLTFIKERVLKWVTPWIK